MDQNKSFSLLLASPGVKVNGVWFSSRARELWIEVVPLLYVCCILLTRMDWCTGPHPTPKSLTSVSKCHTLGNFLSRWAKWYEVSLGWVNGQGGGVPRRTLWPHVYEWGWTMLYPVDSGCQSSEMMTPHTKCRWLGFRLAPCSWK